MATVLAMSNSLPPSQVGPSKDLYVIRDPASAPPSSTARSPPAALSDSYGPTTMPPSSNSPREESPLLIPPHPLSTSRYHRQMLVPSVSIGGQEAITKAKVLIIGLGGLGSPASLYLAAAGIGTLGLVDADTVELSNLHRQIVHTEKSVIDGMSKVESAMQRLRDLNSEIRCVGYKVRFGAGNAVGILEGRIDEMVAVKGGKSGLLVEGGYDIVLDCTDNPATRYLISDVCVALGRVFVSAAAQRGEGQLMRLNYPSGPRPPYRRPGSSSPSPPPSLSHHTTSTTATSPTRAGSSAGEGHRGRGATKEKGPCYRCVFPTPPTPDMVQSCSEIGILGPVVGVMGTLMAMEVLNIITSTDANALARTRENETETGMGEEKPRWTPTLLLYNALTPDPKAMFRSVGLRRVARRDCRACGDEELLKSVGGRKKITRESIESGEIDYPAFCGGGVEGTGKADQVLLDAGSRVTAREFLESMQRRGGPGRGNGSGSGDRNGQEEKEEVLLVDVREQVEYDLGAKIRNSIHIPLSEILRLDRDGETGKTVEDLLGLSGAASEGKGAGEVYFLCQRGNDSQVAARRFLDAASDDSGRSRKRRWIGDVVGGFEALSGLAEASTIQPPRSPPSPPQQEEEGERGVKRCLRRRE